MRLTFHLQSNIDVPCNSFGAGAVMQYNSFLRICDDKTLTSHEWDSLSIISITSESSILTGFHTILRSKLNFKTRLNISLVSNLLGVISVKPPRCPLRVTRPEAPSKRYSASTVVVYRMLIILYGSVNLYMFTQSPQSPTSYLGSTVTAYHTLPGIQRSKIHLIVTWSQQ